MSYAYRCQEDDGDAQWRIERRGDVVVTWACGDCLPTVCDGLQRPWEATELVVTRTKEIAR